MKKHFKLIGVFLCALLIGTSFIFSKSSNNKVYADDSSKVGTANLNNTADNSAKNGNQLLNPEIGWTRYDDTNKNIQYNGSGWAAPNNLAGGYLNTEHYANGGAGYITFKFYGTKFRIITIENNSCARKLDITIDGSTENYSGYDSVSYTTSSKYEILAYEKDNMESGNHEVTIKLDSNASSYGDGGNNVICLDAVDIDYSGYLIDSSATLATGISLDKTSLDMKTGDTINLTATVAPDNSTNKIVKWTSSDPSMATVDANGKITAVKEGSATITASTQDGSNKTATCTVNVKNPADGNALLTVTMTDGQQRTYDIKMSQINDFITWYNNRANGQGNFTYSFNKTPSSAAYTKRTEYLIFDKISNYDVDEYKAQ